MLQPEITHDLRVNTCHYSSPKFTSQKQKLKCDLKKKLCGFKKKPKKPINTTCEKLTCKKKL